MKRMMRWDFLSLSLAVRFMLLQRIFFISFVDFFPFQIWSYSIDQLARGIKTRCVLALISSSVCLFKLAYPIFLFIESIRLVLFLRSRDMIMEQVKQTFRCFFSLALVHAVSLLTTSPPQSISSTGNISFPWLDQIEWKNEWELMLFFFQDLIIVRSVELLFFKFQVLRKQSEAKEWIVIIWRVVHYENVERVVLISTDTSFFFRRRQYKVMEGENMCVCVCNTRGSIGCCLKSTTIFELFTSL